MKEQKPFQMGNRRRLPKMGKFRRIAEEREKNLNFSRAIVHAQHRHNLKAERDRLHGPLYTNLSPALHEKIRDDGNRIFQIVGNS